MIFTFWKKKDEISDKKEKIKIYNEDGNEVLVDKEEWVNGFLKKNIEENYSNPEDLYNIILVAVDYGVYEEVLEATMRLRDLEFNSVRSTEVLLNIYLNLNSYTEIIDLVEEYKKKYNMSSSIYYCYALAYKNLDLIPEYENIVYEAIYNFPNNKKIFNELKNILNNKSLEYKEKVLESLSNIQGSYLICLYFAKLEYENNKISDGNKYSLKALVYSKYKIEIIKTISELLFKYHQYTEFENHILSNFDINLSGIEYCYLVLKYYELLLNYKEGLFLLKQMYEKNIYNENELEKLTYFEDLFLDIKFKKENPLKYEMMENNTMVGEVKFFNILNPIYYYVLDRNELLLYPKSNENNIIMIPFSVDKNITLTSEEKKFINFIPILMLERMYKNYDIKIHCSFKRDDIKILTQEDTYDETYFNLLNKTNPNLSYFISGNIREIDGIKKVEMFRYNFINLKKDIAVYEMDLSSKDELLYKFMNNFSEHFNTRIDLELRDNELDNIYTKLELLFDFKGDNKYKIWKLTYLAKWYINNAKSDEDLLNAISIVKIMKIYGIDKWDKYKGILYEKNLKLNNNPTLIKIMSNIFESSDNNA